MDFKRTQIPAKANMMMFNRIMHFEDKDLEQITDEEISQPCTRGDWCPQKSFGIHTRVCRAETEALTKRGAGQLWHERVLEQEELNTDPMDQGGFLEDQYPHRYNYEDYAPFQRKDSDPEEEEQEEDTK